MADTFRDGFARLVRSLHDHNVGWTWTEVIATRAVEQWDGMLGSTDDGRIHKLDEAAAWSRERFIDHSVLRRGEYWELFLAAFGLKCIPTPPELYKDRLTACFRKTDRAAWQDDSFGNANRQLAERLLRVDTRTTYDYSTTYPMPGSFPSQGVSADSSDNGDLSSELPFHGCDFLDGSDAWSSVGSVLRESGPEMWGAYSGILIESPEAEAYRKLRWGTEGYIDPSRADPLGHGLACDCWGCAGERKQAFERAEKAKIALIPLYHGGGGGGRGRGSFQGPQPRDSDG